MHRFIKQSVCLILFYLTTPVIAESLTPVIHFGDNPGNISMYAYLPADMPEHAPLVVSLHGCTQDARTYSQSGWLTLAEQHQFYLIFPQQSAFNNPLKCWNWFEADNLIRGQGEVQSIVNMIEYLQSQYSIDEDRIFIEGLSAGGFLTPVMLAAYPDVFAAGATHAGGPAFCARTNKYFWDLYQFWYSYQAKINFDKCADGIDRSPEAWGALAHEYGLNDYQSSWPRLSIWHGISDDVVKIDNQTELLEQWSNLHGIDVIADIQSELDTPPGVMHKQYQNEHGMVVIETWTIPDMQHGTAIDASADSHCGKPSDYVLDEKICAMEKIAEFWGLL